MDPPRSALTTTSTGFTVEIEEKTNSFAKTPVKAAQSPLAAARVSHGLSRPMMPFLEGGGARGEEGEGEGGS